MVARWGEGMGSDGEVGLALKLALQRTLGHSTHLTQHSPAVLARPYTPPAATFAPAFLPGSCFWRLQLPCQLPIPTCPHPCARAKTSAGAPQHPHLQEDYLPEDRARPGHRARRLLERVRVLEKRDLDNQKGLDYHSFVDAVLNTARIKSAFGFLHK